MLDLLKSELSALGAFSTELSPVIQRVADTIPFSQVPLRMKYTIAVSDIVLYASQFQRNILHWDGGEVPINAISFVITGSGQFKDSSVNAVRKAFAQGYFVIDDRRKQIAISRAIDLAREAGVDDPHLFANYKPFYRKPNPLFVAPSTTEGFVQHLNDLDFDGIGAGYMYSGEFGAELSTSQTFVDNLKLIAELYDLGNKEVKVLKGRENQSSEIRGLPTSALFVGSPYNILYDEAIKKKFKVEFSTKLARRSNFCFTPELISDIHYPTSAEMIAARRIIDDYALTARARISEAIMTITNYHLDRLSQPIAVSDEVRDLFTIYQRYNSELADTIPKLFTIAPLVRRHLQWKALKIAGAFAMFELEDVITRDHYLDAIRFCELLDVDMQAFETELVKEPYEVFADYIQSIAADNKASISLHNLRKLGYITSGGNPAQRLKDLAHLAASYDRHGLYTSDDSNIYYEAIKPVDTIHISYKAIDNSEIFAAVATKNRSALTIAKEKVAKTANAGLSLAETTFAELSELLSGDFAYSPFRFRDGLRSKDTLLPGTKWLVLDVDTSNITIDEAHFLLSDINHHIATSSDAANPFKFRIIIELDSVVDVSPQVWKHFYLSIAEELGIRVDPLPQSQLFYSYSTSNVLSTLDASPVAVRDHLMFAIDKASDKSVEKPLTKAQVSAALSDTYGTFNYAFECPHDGSGSRTLVRAARHAFDLGMSKDDIRNLLFEINDYWVSPMPTDRIDRTILSQVARW